MTSHFTLEQLSAKTGRKTQTLRLHIRNGWLKAEKEPGVRGWRVKAGEARKWAAKHFGIDLETLA